MTDPTPEVVHIELRGGPYDGSRQDYGHEPADFLVYAGEDSQIGLFQAHESGIRVPSVETDVVHAYFFAGTRADGTRVYQYQGERAK